MLWYTCECRNTIVRRVFMSNMGRTCRVTRKYFEHVQIFYDGFTTCFVVRCWKIVRWLWVIFHDFPDVSIVLSYACHPTRLRLMWKWLYCSIQPCYQVIFKDFLHNHPPRVFTSLSMDKGDKYYELNQYFVNYYMVWCNMVLCSIIQSNLLRGD